jgi:hypothetical protein
MANPWFHFSPCPRASKYWKSLLARTQNSTVKLGEASPSHARTTAFTSPSLEPRVRLKTFASPVRGIRLAGTAGESVAFEHSRGFPPLKAFGMATSSLETSFTTMSPAPATAEAPTHSRSPPSIRETWWRGYWAPSMKTSTGISGEDPPTLGTSTQRLPSGPRRSPGAPKLSPIRSTCGPSPPRALKVHISVSGSWTRASDDWFWYEHVHSRV